MRSHSSSGMKRGKKQYPDARPGSRAASRPYLGKQVRGRRMWIATRPVGHSEFPAFAKRRDALRRCAPGTLPKLV